MIYSWMCWKHTYKQSSLGQAIMLSRDIRNCISPCYTHVLHILYTVYVPTLLSMTIHQKGLHSRGQSVPLGNISNRIRCALRTLYSLECGWQNGLLAFIPPKENPQLFVQAYITVELRRFLASSASIFSSNRRLVLIKLKFYASIPLIHSGG